MKDGREDFSTKEMNFRWRRTLLRAMKEVHHIPMNTRFLPLLSVILSTGLVHAQDTTQKPAAGASPDINKMIQAAIMKNQHSDNTNKYIYLIRYNVITYIVIEEKSGE
jgi:hypothetical protein